MHSREVAEEIFGGKVTPRWVRETLNTEEHSRVQFSHHTVFWEEYTLQRWILSRLGH